MVARLDASSKAVALVLVVLMAIPLSALIVGSQDTGNGYVKACSVPIAAVSIGGEGVIGRLTVKISYPGSGKVYISTSPASEVDTQGSARIAAFAASLLAGVDMLDYDFYYDIESPSIIVGGPSAGSAMALATYQLLVEGGCDSTIVATGMIQPDTSIGPVGGLKEKLEATAREGKSVFIIPAGQEEYTYVARKVERAGPLIRIIEEPVRVDLVEYGKELGVRVISASTLEEAYKLGVVGVEVERESREPVKPPRWVEDMLKSYVSRVNSTLNEYLGRLENVESSYLKALIEEAQSHEYNSVRLLREGLVYPAAVEAVLGVIAAEKAYAISYALSHELDVTMFVDEANKTLNTAWDTASRAIGAIEYSIQADTLIKAYSKAGLASYFYSKGIEELVSDHSSYKLPYSILSGVDPRGVEDVVTAKWLADWATLWANISTSIQPGGVEVRWDRVDMVARLLLAQAKTTTAYVEALLKESGSGRGVEVSIYLSNLAMSSDNPLAVIGLAIESIAESTKVIHEVFTLDPQRTEQGLEMLAYRMATATSNLSLQPQLLLQAASQASDVGERLLTVSRAVLYAWAINEIAMADKKAATTVEIGGSSITSTLTETSTTTVTETITVTRTETLEKPTGELDWLALSLLAGFILGIASYWLMAGVHKR